MLKITKNKIEYKNSFGALELPVWIFLWMSTLCNNIYNDVFDINRNEKLVYMARAKRESLVETFIKEVLNRNCELC